MDATKTVAIDLEVFNANQKQLHRPHGQFAMLSIADGKTVWVILDQCQVSQALANVVEARWVFHNAAFDVAHLRRWAKIKPRPADRFWDTMIMERILWNGYYSDYGLKDLARRYLDLPMGKELRKEFYKGSVVTPEMMVYGALDAHITWQIQEKQELEVCLDPSVWSVWDHIDCPAFWAIQDVKGLTLDMKRWMGMNDMERERANRIRAELEFNPGSPPQTMSVLKAYAKEIKNSALARIPNSKEDTLKPFGHLPLVASILEYREAAKRAGTYGEGFLEYVEKDKKVHASYDVTGAITGRMASRDPNQQNIPREKTYRACFVAAKGNVLIITDVSAQEPKITAEASRDTLLLGAFEAGEDIHWTVTKALFHIPDDAPIDKAKRAIGKAINLGMVYGLSARGLAERTGLPFHEAEDLIARYFQRFRGVWKWIQRQHFDVERDGIVRTLSGRRMFVNPYSWQWPNHAVNMPIQGTAADQIKLALCYLHELYGEDLPIAAIVHDELVSECKKKDAERVKADIIAAFEYAASVLTPHVSLKNLVEVHVGLTWADKG